MRFITSDFKHIVKLRKSFQKHSLPPVWGKGRGWGLEPLAMFWGKGRGWGLEPLAMFWGKGRVWGLEPLAIFWGKGRVWGLPNQKRIEEYSLLLNRE